MPFTDQTFKALTRAMKNLSFPVRQKSYQRPDFWADPLTITRCRPLPAAAMNWTDVLVIPTNDGYAKHIESYIAQPFTEGAVEFRWIQGMSVLDGNYIDLPATVSRHLDRLEAHPFPCKFRPFRRNALANSQFKIQARNLTAAPQLIFVAVYGWYWTNLQNPNELTDKTGITDTVRNV